MSVYMEVKLMVTSINQSIGQQVQVQSAYGRWNWTGRYLQFENISGKITHKIPNC